MKYLLKEAFAHLLTFINIIYLKVINKLHSNVCFFKLTFIYLSQLNYFKFKDNLLLI